MTSVEEVVEDVAMIAAVVTESAGTLGGHIEIRVNNAAASIQAPLQAGHLVSGTPSRVSSGVVGHMPT